MGKTVNRLTEKRMADRRFRINEQKIIDAFIGDDNYISIEAMAKKAGVARSTFYRHHKTVGRIVPDYRRFILRKYERMIRKLNKEGVSLEVICLKSLYFIIYNKRAFKILMKYNGRETIIEMAEVLNDRVSKYARLPKNCYKMLDVFNSEIAEILYEWIRRGNPEKEVEELSQEVLYLAKTIRKRLGALQD